VPTAAADILAIMQAGVTRQIPLSSITPAVLSSGTWVLGSNITELRAMGVVTGSAQARQQLTTCSGSGNGLADVRGIQSQVTLSGSESTTNTVVLNPQLELRHTAGTAIFARTLQGYARLGLSSSTVGSVTTLRALDFHIAHEGVGGSINTATVYHAGDVDLQDGSGTIASMYGFRTGDLGHATRITAEAIGYDTGNMTAGAPLTAAFRSQMSSGTGKFGFYASGSADNFFEGKVKFGTTGIAANNGQTVTVSNVGPASSGISILEWASVKNAAGTTRYIALFG
jgi:hypothetical protein